MAFSWGGFALKALELALIADQQYEATQVPGGNVSTILAPNNFNNLIMELAQVAAPAPPVVVAPPNPTPTQVPAPSPGPVAVAEKVQVTG